LSAHLLFAGLTISQSMAAGQPKFLGKKDFAKPAMLSVFQDPVTKKDNLYISTFDLPVIGVADSVSYVQDIGSQLEDFSNIEAFVIPGSVTWPNEVKEGNTEIFGGNGIAVAGGFLVPFKSNGGIWYSPQNEQGDFTNWVNLYQKNGWFYHRIEYYDVNQDGKLDIITCRARKSLFGGTDFRLVWLEPSDRSNPLDTWVEREINSNCDTYFRIVDLQDKKRLLSPQFFGKKFTLITSDNGNFFNDGYTEKVDIDRNVGAAFDTQYVDLNNDGKLDVLLSNHQGRGESPTGSVYAYEVPDDIYKSEWKRHTLAEDFPVKNPLPNQASPGDIYAFYPKVDDKQNKPYIAVSGDAAFAAYVLIPKSQDPNDWTYDLTVLHDCGGTVGSLAVGDFNQDGYSDIIVSCYDGNNMVAYTYAP